MDDVVSLIEKLGLAVLPELGTSENQVMWKGTWQVSWILAVHPKAPWTDSPCFDRDAYHGRSFSTVSEAVRTAAVWILEREANCE